MRCIWLLVIAACAAPAASIDIDSAIHFTGADGGDVVAQGAYKVVPGENDTLLLVPEKGDALGIRAQTTNHHAKVDAPTAVTAYPAERAVHLILYRPDGTALEAAGSTDGVRTRGMPRLVANKPAGRQTLAVTNILGPGDMVFDLKKEPVKILAAKSGWRSIEYTVDSAAVLPASWVSWLAAGGGSKNGLLYGAKGGVAFRNARITSVSFPELNAAAKDHGRATLRFRAAGADSRSGTAGRARKEPTTDFIVEHAIAGWPDTLGVHKIEAWTWQVGSTAQVRVHMNANKDDQKKLAESIQKAAAQGGPIQGALTLVLVSGKTRFRIRLSDLTVVSYTPDAVSVDHPGLYTSAITLRGKPACLKG